jgi:hypothetical protein
MKWIAILAFVGFVTGPSVSSGQDERLELRIARYVFSPGTTMKHQGQLAHTERQEEGITEKTRTFRDQVDELQGGLERRTEGWLEMSAQDAAGPEPLLPVFDGIVGPERGIERHHMAMLLDIRAVLTVDQGRTLQKIMLETPSRTEGPGAGGEGGREERP